MSDEKRPPDSDPISTTGDQNPARTQRTRHAASQKRGDRARTLRSITGGPRRATRTASGGGDGSRPPSGSGGLGGRPRRPTNRIEELDRIAAQVIHNLRFTKVDAGRDACGRRKSRYDLNPVCPQRAHAIFTGLKLRVDLWSSFEVGEKLSAQREELDELATQIQRLKQQRGEA
jgi:hypothetical protein